MGDGMMGHGVAKDWIAAFPALADLDAPLRQRVVAGAVPVEAAAGQSLFSPGDRAEQLILLMDGQVRVQHVSPGGRQIVLYRIRAGESCILTTACLLSGEPLAAEGIAETAIKAVALPGRVVDQAMAASPLFRAFVFKGYARRLADLFAVIDDVAFQRVDIRLAQRLLALRDGADLVHATHQHLADELGSAREVISRQLSDFHARGLISQGRGRIQLTDRDRLSRLAESAGGCDKVTDRRGARGP